MSSIRLDAGEAGEIELSRPTREAYAAYHDAMQDERTADAFRNLWAACAVSPGPSDLPALIADFDALPTFIAAELSKEAGGTGTYRRVDVAADLAGAVAKLAEAQKSGRGIEEAEVCVSAFRSRAEQLQAAKKLTKREPLAYETPAGLLFLRRSGGGDAYVDGKGQANGGKGSHYAVARSLMLARALVPDAAALAVAIDQYPAMPVVLELELIGEATGGKAPARL